MKISALIDKDLKTKAALVTMVAAGIGVTALVLYALTDPAGAASAIDTTPFEGLARTLTHSITVMDDGTVLREIRSCIPSCLAGDVLTEPDVIPTGLTFNKTPIEPVLNVRPTRTFAQGFNLSNPFSNLYLAS